MKKALYILIPVSIAVLMFFVSVNIIFRVPNPNGIGLAQVTYKVAWMFAIGSFIISGIVSVFLYFRSKKGR